VSAWTRNPLIHAHLGLTFDLVWDVVWKKIPLLRKEVQEILKKENTG